MQTMETARFLPNPLAILFTNASGRVVFANRNFLRLTRQAASRVIAGERLAALLPIESQSAEKMIAAIDHSGYLGWLAISVSTVTGSLFPAAFSGIAARDESGVFIGADILLDAPTQAEARTPGMLPPRHADVLRKYVTEVFSEGQQAPAKTFIQAYVVAQVDMLQVLLARMGGSGMRGTLERILNETAVKNDIQAGMRDGYLEFAATSMHFGVYRTLLNAAVDYSINAVGQRIVKQEMEAVDRYIDAGLLELLTQMDLRTIFRNG